MGPAPIASGEAIARRERPSYLVIGVNRAEKRPPTTPGRLSHVGNTLHTTHTRPAYLAIGAGEDADIRETLARMHHTAHCTDEASIPCDRRRSRRKKAAARDGPDIAMRLRKFDAKLEEDAAAAVVEEEDDANEEDGGTLLSLRDTEKGTPCFVSAHTQKNAFLQQIG